MRIRRLESEEDVEEVLALLARLEEQTGVPPLGESKFVDLGGLRAGEGFVGEDGGTIAYLHLLRHETSRVWEMELATGGLDDADTTALLAAATELAGAAVLWWTFGDTGAARFAADRFPVARTLHKLTGPVPPSEPVAIPPGVEIRPFRPGTDEEAWLAANNAAFAGHPENGDWQREDVIERQSRSWFEADGFRLAWVGERVAGFCWTKRHAPELGEIHVIGVDPAFQGRGLGREIVIEALWHLAAVGCRSGFLYVDTANATALELYQSLGFGLERIDRCFSVPKGWPHEVQ